MPRCTIDQFPHNYRAVPSNIAESLSHVRMLTRRETRRSQPYTADAAITDGAVRQPELRGFSAGDVPAATKSNRGALPSWQPKPLHPLGNIAINHRVVLVSANRALLSTSPGFPHHVPCGDSPFRRVPHPLGERARADHSTLRQYRRREGSIARMVGSSHLDHQRVHQRRRSRGVGPHSVPPAL